MRIERTPQRAPALRLAPPIAVVATAMALAPRASAQAGPAPAATATVGAPEEPAPPAPPSRPGDGARLARPFATATPPPPPSEPPPPDGYPPGQYMVAPAYPPPPILPPPGAREHDGFYLRIGVGGGRLGGSFGSNDSGELHGSFDGSFGRGSLSFELSIGGTPAPGLVIGGGIWTDTAIGQPVSTDIRVNGKSAAPLVFDRAMIGLLGPFVDYYVDPKQGLHVQGALGIAWMNLGQGTRGSTIATDDKNLGGIGFMLGGGYEWWVSEQWSLGALLRFLYVSTESNRNDADVWMGKGYAFPEILFGATYH